MSKTSKSSLNFNSSGFLTIGAEVELQIIDKKSLNLSSKANTILEDENIKSNHNIKAELFANTVEINSKKCNNVAEIEQDLEGSFNIIAKIGENLGIDFAATASHPLCKYISDPYTSNDRYKKLVKNRRWITRLLNTYGLHIHLGMKDGQDCIKFINFLSYFLPHFLAISSSSPFWEGYNTGLSSSRPINYEAMPTIGCPHLVESWKDFETFYNNLEACGSASCTKDLWWDIRPAPRFGTLEIRVCDSTATLQETSSVIAYIHLLSYWFNDNKDNKEIPTIDDLRWLMRENKWRIMRDALDADFVINGNFETIPIKESILQWLDKVSPYIIQLKYEKYVKDLKEIISCGNSSQRQQNIYQKTKSVKEVIKLNINEFVNRKPLWQ